MSKYPPRNTEYGPDLRVMIAIYGWPGLEMIPIDWDAREAIKTIVRLYADIRTMSDENEIALARQRIADLKQQRVEYVEHCQLHNRDRRS